MQTFGLFGPYGQGRSDALTKGKKTLESLGQVYQPNILIADAEDAITSGFRQAFGDPFTRVTCWAHVNRAYEKKLACISNNLACKFNRIC